MDQHQAHDLVHQWNGGKAANCPSCNGSMDAKETMAEAKRIAMKNAKPSVNPDLPYSQRLQAFGEKTKEEKTFKEPMLRTMINLMQFSEGTKIPSKIKIFPYQTIKDHPEYGTFSTNKEQFQDMIKHFNEDVRASSSTIGLPVDIEHGTTEKYKDAAAGWIKKLFAEEDGGYAEIDWTPLGKKVLEDKEYKLCSPGFWFNFQHPETGEVYQNVLGGIGLVNKPGMPSLPPIVNSEHKNTPLTDKNKTSTIFIELKESVPNMNLKDIVAKEKTARTSDEQKFLVEHKEELSFAEYKKQGFLEVKTEKEETKVEMKETPKTGQVIMSEAEVTELRTFKEELDKEKAVKMIKELTFSEKGIKLPTDQVDKAAETYLKLDEAGKKTFKEMLSSLPEKEIFTENGTTHIAPAGTAAIVDLDKKIKEFREANKGTSYGDAVKALNANPENQLLFKEATAKENMQPARFE